MEAGGQVAEQAGQALAGVENVTIHPQHQDEPVDALQHELGELLAGEEARLPVLLDLLRLDQNSQMQKDIPSVLNRTHCTAVVSVAAHCPIFLPVKALYFSLLFSVNGVVSLHLCSVVSNGNKG